MTYSAPDYSTPPESVAATPATRPNPAVAVFGWLGLVSVLAIAGLTIGYIYTGFIVLALLFMPFAVIIAASAGA